MSELPRASHNTLPNPTLFHLADEMFLWMALRVAPGSIIRVSRLLRDGSFAFPPIGKKAHSLALYPCRFAGNHESFCSTAPRLRKLRSTQGPPIWNIEHRPFAREMAAWLSTLLMDSNSGWRALRKRILMET